MNNNAVINGPAAADTSTSAVVQPLILSTDGQEPTPSTPGGVVSANGTTPSPAGPSSNGECCNRRNTKVTVNGTAVIYLKTSLVFFMLTKTGKYRDKFGGSFMFLTFRFCSYIKRQLHNRGFC